MRIVSHVGLAKLPEGTIFSPLHGVQTDTLFTLECRGLYRKGKSLETYYHTAGHFFASKLTPSFGCRCNESWESIGQPRMDTMPRRWPTFDITRRYVVYEGTEVLRRQLEPPQ